MSAAEARSEIEEDRSWRSEEVRLLRNQLSSLSEDKKGVLRRSLVIMVYAHLEGFCRRALEIYVARINDLELTVGQVEWNLAAASLSETFDKLHNKDLKCKVFKRALPDDAKLHRFARDRDFLEAIGEFEKSVVRIDSECVVDAESNLKPAVLRKMLYRIGLDHSIVDSWSALLNRLIGKRNNIAHGASRAPVSHDDYEVFEYTADAVMDAITTLVFDSLYRSRFLRTGSASS